MSIALRISWFWWRVRFVAYLRRIGVYKKRLSALPHAWAESGAYFDYFDMDYTPEEAFAEDMSYAD